MLSHAENTKHEQTKGDNPAWDFLVRACALFAPVKEIQEMKCPFCNHDVPSLWQKFFAINDWHGVALEHPHSEISSLLPEMPTTAGDTIELIETVAALWMVCPNDACRQILVLVKAASQLAGIPPAKADFKAWYGLPPKPLARPLDPLVGDPYRRDYLEASLILDDSPRMSSVLSRRILQDLLEQFAGRTEYKLEDRIDNFIADTKYPSSIKDNLHHLRDIANFGAHTKTDKATGEIIDVDRDEAEWTLEVVDGLFDYFIVGPEKDKQRRADWDAKRGQTGAPRPVRKPKTP